MAGYKGKSDEKSEEKVEAAAPTERNDSVGDVVREVLKEVLPAAVAAGIEAGQASRKGAAPKKDLPTVLSTCSACRQPNMACKGKHRMARVLPYDDDQIPWFQGVKINGVTYLSPPDGREVVVPEKANVEYMVQAWSQNERELVRGKKRIRNSGSIGPGGAATLPVGPGDYFR